MLTRCMLMCILLTFTWPPTAVLQVDFGEDVCIFGEKFVVGLTEEIERVSGRQNGRQADSSTPVAAAACIQLQPLQQHR